ncbi:hypothetical protein P885DRAFT_78378 [Corynascus similis CBS 632.67]
MTHGGAAAVPGADIGPLEAPPPDANTSSFVVAKCSSTVFCVGRSVLLWIIVLAVFLLGALRNRVLPAARHAAVEGDKKT